VLLYSGAGGAFAVYAPIDHFGEREKQRCRASVR